MVLGNALFLGRVLSRERKTLVDSGSSGSSIQSGPAHIESSSAQRNVNTSRYISAANLSGDSTPSSLHNSIRFIYELVEYLCTNLLLIRTACIALYMTLVYQVILVHFRV